MARGIPTETVRGEIRPAAEWDMTVGKCVVSYTKYLQIFGII